jgi:hypothetical protein
MKRLRFSSFGYADLFFFCMAEVTTSRIIGSPLLRCMSRARMQSGWSGFIVKAQNSSDGGRVSVLMYATYRPR